MRVLLIGATSPIGVAIAGALGATGHAVTTAGRLAGDIRLDLAAPGRRRRLLDSEGDPIQCDAVINLAAQLGGPDLVGRREAWRVNAHGAAVSAGIAATSGAAHLVQVSTAYSAFPECYPGPASYVVGKAAGEVKALHAARLAGVACAVLRFTHIYDSAGACRPNQELPYHFADRAAAGEPITLHGSGSARRDYLHLDDAVSATLRVVERRSQGILVLSSPATLSLLEVAHAASAAFGSASEVRVDRTRPEPPGMPEFRHDWSALGIEPSIDMAAGFARLREARA